MLWYEFAGRPSTVSPVSVTMTVAPAARASPMRAAMSADWPPAAAMLGERRRLPQPGVVATHEDGTRRHGRVPIVGEVAAPAGPARQVLQHRRRLGQQVEAGGEHRDVVRRALGSDPLHPQVGRGLEGRRRRPVELDPGVARVIAALTQHGGQVGWLRARCERDRMPHRPEHVRDPVEHGVGGRLGHPEPDHAVDVHLVQVGAHSADGAARPDGIGPERIGDCFGLDHLQAGRVIGGHGAGGRSAGMYPSCSSQWPPSMVRFSPVM